jgi:hypothetical protein
LLLAASVKCLAWPSVACPFGACTDGSSAVAIDPKEGVALGIHVNNQFGPEQLDTVKEEEFCVPSEKIP